MILAVGADNNLYAKDITNNTKAADAFLTDPWLRVKPTPDNIVSVIQLNDGALIAIGTNAKLYYAQSFSYLKNNNNWVKINPTPTTLNFISIIQLPDGYILALDDKSKFYLAAYSPTTFIGAFTPAVGAITNIPNIVKITTVKNSSLVWAISDDPMIYTANIPSSNNLSSVTWSQSNLSLISNTIAQITFTNQIFPTGLFIGTSPNTKGGTKMFWTKSYVDPLKNNSQNAITSVVNPLSIQHITEIQLTLRRAVAIGVGAMNTDDDQIMVGTSIMTVALQNFKTTNTIKMKFILGAKFPQIVSGYGLIDTTGKIGANYSGGTIDGTNGQIQISVMRNGSSITLLTGQSDNYNINSVTSLGKLQLSHGLQCVSTLTTGSRYAPFNFFPFVTNDQFSGELVLAYSIGTPTSTARVEKGYGMLVFSQNSDYRIKENIKPSGSLLNRLCAVPMFDYEFKNTGTIMKQGNHVGFYAHVLQDAFPEYPNFIKGRKDGVDEAGNISPQHISTDFPILLMKTIQEQNVIIKQLQKDIIALNTLLDE